MSDVIDVRTKEIGKLRFCQYSDQSFESINIKGRFGRVFKGDFEETVDVAIERIKKRDFIVELDVIRKAQNHPNIIRYYCSEEDAEFV